nr:hypothetical protein [Hymenobacter sp. HDW8]
MVIVQNGEAIVFDTPATASASRELLEVIERQWKARVTAVVPTHFHDDCLGGYGNSTNAVFPPTPMRSPSSWRGPKTPCSPNRVSRIGWCYAWAGRT